MSLDRPVWMYAVTLLMDTCSCLAVILMLVCFNPQLFWERKLSGLNAFDIAEELVKTMDLPKGLQGEESPKI